MMVDVTGTLLEGVAGTLVAIETILTVASTLVVIETVLIVEVVKCEWVSKRCVPICGTLLSGGVTTDVLVVSAVSLYTSDDCDDDVSVTSELEISAVSLYTSDDCDENASITSELVISVVSLYTLDDCDDDLSAEYVDTVEQCLGITVYSSEPQHIVSPLVQLVQSLLLSNVMLMVLMSDGVSVSFA